MTIKGSGYAAFDGFYSPKSNLFHFSLAYVKKKQYLCSVKGKKEDDMPTLFNLFGFRFMFYSNDHEPVHVHVIKDQKHEAKFSVEPEVRLLENNGLKASELRLAESVIEENKEIIVNRWKEYFKN